MKMSDNFVKWSLMQSLDSYNVVTWYLYHMSGTYNNHILVLSKYLSRGSRLRALVFKLAFLGIQFVSDHNLTEPAQKFRRIVCAMGTLCILQISQPYAHDVNKLQLALNSDYIIITLTKTRINRCQLNHTGYSTHTLNSCRETTTNRKSIS